MSGKGDTYRPVDGEVFRSAWERIFRSRIDAIKRETRGMIHGITEAEADDRVVFEASYVMYDAHLRHRPEPDTLPKHTQEGHGESDPAERQNTDCRTAP